MKLMKKQIMLTSLLLVFVFATSSITLTHVNGLVNDNSDTELSIVGLYNEDFDYATYKDPITTAWGWGSGALTNERDFSWALLDFYNTPNQARSVDVQGRKVYVSQFKLMFKEEKCMSANLTPLLHLIQLVVIILMIQVTFF
ncbi:MAG: hypothetical protein ACTSPF_02020 [Candidatus Heimdallarchaeaceae archaeon]